MPQGSNLHLQIPKDSSNRFFCLLCKILTDKGAQGVPEQVDISRVLTEKNIDILSMHTRVNKQGVATMQTSFEITSSKYSRIIGSSVTGLLLLVVVFFRNQFTSLKIPTKSLLLLFALLMHQFLFR